MGLPCAHICDIKRATGGLIPSDFHEHWYWDRKSTLRPLLDPLRARKQHLGNLRVACIGRILSIGEEPPAKQPPVCSACHRQGHTRTSRNCPLKLQASIASQNQLLLDSEVAVAEQQQLATRPTTTISIIASIPATAYLLSYDPSYDPSYNLVLSLPVSIPVTTPLLSNRLATASSPVSILSSQVSINI